MANYLYCHVFRDAAAANKGSLEQAIKVEITSPAQLSEAVDQAGTTPVKFVRFWSDADCFVAWGSSPEATTTDIPIGGGHGPESFEIPASYKISVLAKT